MKISRPAAPPPLRYLWREVLAIVRLWQSHARSVHASTSAAQGDPVMVIPGFLANDATTAPLRRVLSDHGYAVYGWGQGTNFGATEAIAGRLEADVAAIAAQGRPVHLIGWSLGGLYAREIARRAPQHVAQVITLGSPFSGDLRANRGWRLYEWINRYPVDAPPMDVDPATKPPVTTIAIWSRFDGIVPQGCARGQPGQADRVVEVPCTHMGFVFEEAALDAVLRALGEAVGEAATSPSQVR